MHERDHEAHGWIRNIFQAKEQVVSLVQKPTRNKGIQATLVAQGGAPKSQGSQRAGDDDEAVSKTLRRQTRG